MSQLAPNLLVIRKALNGTRAVYSIAKHPKLYLATNGAGGGSWRIKYRPRRGAVQRWYTISDDARHTEFEAVSRKANELLSNLALKGIDPHSDRPRHESTFGDTFEHWLERYGKVHKKSWAADEKLYFRHIDSRLGSDPIRSIDRPRVIEVLDDIARKATPLQANRCQSLISAVFSWALDEGRISTHPALRIRRRGEEKVRELVMTPDQLKLFWGSLQSITGRTPDILKLLTLLGCRLSEVAGARQSELQLDGGAPQWVIPGERTKNGLTHVVPLPPQAATIFRRVTEANGGNQFVFPARRRTPQAFDGNEASRECKKLLRSIGAGDMRLHDLRHQTATGMAECGVPLDIRQLVQNQITGRRQSIGARYDQHDYGTEKRRALELWERRLLAIINGQQKPLERY